ncbi:MAG: hypothetical protein ABIP94_20065, partial [Planctomycetota bacterium]
LSQITKVLTLAGDSRVITVEPVSAREAAELECLREKPARGSHATPATQSSAAETAAASVFGTVS